MLFEEVEKLYIVKDGVTYTPLTTCEIKADEKGNVYGNYTIIKTAQEVYQECINPTMPQASEQEVLNAQLLKENADIRAQLAEQQELTANLLLQVASLKGGSTSV